MKYKILVAILIASFSIATMPMAKAPEIVQEVIVTDHRAEIIDAYFAKKGMPLAGHGKKFVEVADKYDLDWRLLPALSIREQSGGKVLPHNCPNRTINRNAFGWGSGSICFTTFDEAIETVGMKLGTHRYYAGKTLIGKLQTYNPPSVVANYAYEVIAIMENISPNE